MAFRNTSWVASLESDFCSGIPGWFRKTSTTAYVGCGRYGASSPYEVVSPTVGEMVLPRHHCTSHTARPEAFPPMIPTTRSKLRRLPERGSHEWTAVVEILDAGFLAFVGFVLE